MKKLVIAFVMATLVASPAFAKKRQAISPEAAAAQASAPRDSDALTVDAYTVVVNGEIVGRDPDPSVRHMLRRDPKADGAQ
jgi:hypothetical protein